jgi:hypothetical protein
MIMEGCQGKPQISIMDKICPHRLISEGRVEQFYQMIRDEYSELLRQQIKDAVKRGIQHE